MTPPTLVVIMGFRQKSCTKPMIMTYGAAPTGRT